MIRVIIFDLDGTLVNAYRAVTHSINHTLVKMGHPPRTYAEIKRAVGFGDKQLLAGFLGKENVEKAIRIYRAHHGNALAAKGGVILLPGVKALLPYLKSQGVSLAIATNRPYRFTAIILKQLELRKYFDIVLSPDRAPRPKPFPDMLDLIVKRKKINKSEAIFVGDMDIDVNTGRNARVRTVAVTTGSCSAEELKALQPWHIISKISQLKSVIKA